MKLTKKDDCLHEKTFVVLVAFGVEDTSRSLARLSAVLGDYEATVITVDTSRRLEVESGGDVNDAFEFSGYEHGLSEACLAVRRSNVENYDNCVCRVVFINSTAFTAHIALIAKSFVRRALSMPAFDAGAPTVVGLRWEANGATKDAAGLGWYYATNLFCITAPMTMLAAFRFFDKDQVHRFRSGNFSELSSAYRGVVTDWLCPKGVLAGWYKASPFVMLPASEIIRKRITIYLEHSLPERFSGAGLKLTSFNENAEARIRRFFRCLIIIDRLYVNMLKLGYRSRHIAFRFFSGSRAQ